MTPVVKVTVPSTANVSEPITEAAHAARVQRVAGALSRMFGGATARPASGYWVASDGSLVAEKVTEVSSLALDGLTAEMRERLRSLAAGWARDWSQECVLLEMGREAELIEPIHLVAEAA